MTAQLPPGYHTEDADEQDGTVVLVGPRGPDRVPLADAADVAWADWLCSLRELPDPIPPGLPRHLCLAYADAVAMAATGRDSGPSRPAAGQRAAARALHVDERTVRKWCAGDRPMPWAAAELLRRLADD
jgi:hypothetical protein